MVYSAAQTADPAPAGLAGLAGAVATKDRTGGQPAGGNPVQIWGKPADGPLHGVPPAAIQVDRQEKKLSCARRRVMPPQRRREAGTVAGVALRYRPPRSEGGAVQGDRPERRAGQVRGSLHRCPGAAPTAGERQRHEKRENRDRSAVPDRQADQLSGVGTGHTYASAGRPDKRSGSRAGQPTSAGSSIADSSTSPIKRRASRGSIRPAPNLAVDSAPQATPKRRHWSGVRRS
jgi:hypothetical protein